LRKPFYNSGFCVTFLRSPRKKKFASEYVPVTKFGAAPAVPTGEEAAVKLSEICTQNKHMVGFSKKGIYGNYTYVYSYVLYTNMQ
jgi:hypothetical protein